MRKAFILALFASASSVATASSADYYLQIKGVAVAGGYTYLDVRSTGDLDGDGLPDDAVVRLQCAGSTLEAADYSVKPRDAASGQASGKRMHKPITFVKEWSATTPQLARPARIQRKREQGCEDDARRLDRHQLVGCTQLVRGFSGCGTRPPSRGQIFKTTEKKIDSSSKVQRHNRVITTIGTT